MTGKNSAPWYTWVYPDDFKTVHPDEDGPSVDSTATPASCPRATPTGAPSEAIRESLLYSYKQTKNKDIEYEDTNNHAWPGSTS